jgi:uncharacterized protein YrrD
MRKSRKFVSMPIISLEEGVQIGTVKSLIVNPAKMEIAAIVVGQRGWFKEEKIIPYLKISKIGNDAITVDQSGNAQKPINLPEILKLIKEKADPIGAKVIMEDGTILGSVDEYYIEENTGIIKELELSSRFLESLYKGKALLSTEHIRTIGPEVIVAKNSAQSNLKKLDGGLQETLQSIKEGTSTIWESTKNRTKEISKTIKEKYEKKDADDPKDEPKDDNESPEIEIPPK